MFDYIYTCTKEKEKREREREHSLVQNNRLLHFLLCFSVSVYKNLIEKNEKKIIKKMRKIQQCDS